MRVCGVICEYNPFHNGHLHHLREARRLSGADYVVCCMSGAVTQRGTFARHDKFARARMALQGGADLVLELPARFACAAADEFAAGGAALLGGLGVVTHLSFGCEPEALDRLEPAARLLGAESPAFQAALSGALAQGQPYPAAYARAAEAVLGPADAGILALPNAALALQYLSALPEGVIPLPVAREGRRHGEDGLGALAGAGAIRRALEEGCPPERLAPSLPFADLVAEEERRGRMHPENALELVLLQKLRASSARSLSALAGVGEGLENRLLAAARQAGSREALLGAVQTRRLTRARLSRIPPCALLDITKDCASAHPRPAYARVLGFRKSAQPLLHAVRRRAALPLVVKCADYQQGSPLFELDVRAQDLWQLGCANPRCRAAGRDFVTSPVIL